MPHTVVRVARTKLSTGEQEMRWALKRVRSAERKRIKPAAAALLLTAAATQRRRAASPAALLMLLLLLLLLFLFLSTRRPNIWTRRHYYGISICRRSMQSGIRWLGSTYTVCHAHREARGENYSILL